MEENLLNFRGKFHLELMPLIDDYFKREELLIRRGWRAFVPELRFYELYCDTQEDIQLLRDAKVESLKERILFQYYSSPLLNRLRAQSRAWLEKFPNIISYYPHALTPAGQRFAELVMCHREEFKKLHKPFLDEKLTLKALDSATHSTIVHSQQGLLFDFSDTKDRVRLYKAVVDEVGSQLGFTFDKKLSTGASPIFSKQFKNGSKILLVVDKYNLGRNLCLDMHIAAYPFGESSNRKAHEAIGILIQDYFCPVNDVYRQFESNAELEANIRAYLCCYQTIQNEFETIFSNLPLDSTETQT